ncbi:hypothetical protein [Amaricoccus sp. W119]|uniref:hypothetical protein n=1 Tax=Amaricoccus sp. W119 TaxID=3391833 RepID=UPI0039A5C074
MTTIFSLEFDEIFARTSPLGHAFSEKLTDLGGETVRMRGFLAPAVPGKSEALVLTRRPAAVGTQGGTDDGWPDDAVFVLPASGKGAFSPGRRAEVEGILEHGPERIADMPTLVRLRAARLTTL